MTSNAGSEQPPGGESGTPAPRSGVEALVVGGIGAGVSFCAGAAVGGVRVGLLAGSVGGVNGAISGWRQVYDWRSVKGVAALTLDSTWALGTTLSGVVAHAVGAVRGRPGYSDGLSRRQNRHVYARGFQPRARFATTFGNVVNGAGDLANPRRARLVTDHEDVHVWQARGFGPLYPVLYVGWVVGGAVGGALLWATRRRDEPFLRIVESCAYYLNPFEYWAYSRDDHWPPRGLAGALGPRRPAVRSFASFRR